MAHVRNIKAYIKNYKKITSSVLDGVIKEIKENEDLIQSASFVNCSLMAPELHLNSGDMNSLMSALKNAKLLTELNFGSNYLGCEGAREIATHLADFPMLTSLNLSNNGIRLQGMRALITAMSALSRKIHLQVKMNALSVEETYQLIKLARSLAPRQEITFLDIHEHLEAKDNETAYAWSVLKECPVRKLKITNSRFDEKEIKRWVDVIESKQQIFLEELDLSSNGITDSVAESIYHLRKQFPKLKLNLSNNCISVRNLEYKETSVDFPDLFAKLAVYPVKKLTIYECGICNFEVEQLVICLRKIACSALTEIDLANNKITDRGADILFELIRTYPHLKINIAGNAVSLKRLEYKETLPPAAFDDLLLKLRFYSIEKLKLSGEIAEEQLKQLFEFIQSNPSIHLSELDMSEGYLSPGIEKLLCNLKASCPGLNIKLAQQTILEYKKIDFSADNFDTILNKLKLYPISKLALNNCKVGVDEVAALGIQLLTRKGGLVDVDFSNIENPTSEEKLRNNLENSSGKPLAAIVLTSNIATLNLANNRIGDVGAGEIAKVLKESKLLTLDLSGNCIGIKGGHAIKESGGGKTINLLRNVPPHNTGSAYKQAPPKSITLPLVVATRINAIQFSSEENDYEIVSPRVGLFNPPKASSIDLQSSLGDDDYVDIPKARYV